MILNTFRFNVSVDRNAAFLPRMVHGKAMFTLRYSSHVGEDDGLADEYGAEVKCQWHYVTVTTISESFFMT